MLSIYKSLKQNKNWVIIAILIFLGGIATCGLSSPAGPGQAGYLEQLIGTQLEGLENIQEIFQGLPLPIMVLVIFINNMISIFQMLLLGFLAGLSPLFTLFINGMLIGIISGAIAGEGLSLWAFICLGILPHGIFELPAFFICGAFGLKFGYHCVASPLPGLSRKQSFFYIWKEVASMFPLIIALLAIGAVIEVYISQELLLRYLGV